MLGIVKAAELKEGGAVLQVAHSPPVSMGREGKPPFLPVSLFGVAPTVNGLSWLQIVLNSQKVQFTVLSTDLKSAKSLVMFNVSYSSKPTYLTEECIPIFCVCSLLACSTPIFGISILLKFPTLKIGVYIISHFRKLIEKSQF